MPGPDEVAWLLDRSPDAALLTDPDGIIQYVNPAFEALTGFERGEALGHTPAILRSGKQTSEFYDRLWSTVRSGREFCDVLVNRRKDGQIFHHEETIRPLFDSTGRISHFLSSGRDVSERVAALERLTHAAMHDELTGLPNRACFADRLARLMRGSQRDGDQFALALVDVNDFKLVNDERGHPAGDAVLREVGLRLQRAVRDVDTVARLGGDEFGLLLPRAGAPAQLERILRKIVAAFRAPICLERGMPMALTVSIGACIREPAEHDEQRLLERADTAMYSAKRSGRSGSCFRLHGCATSDSERAASAPIQTGAPRSLHAMLRLLEGGMSARRRLVYPGDVVYRAGQAFANIYVIMAGSAKLVSTGADGHERLVGMKIRGDWLGLDGIGKRRYAWDAVATDTGEFLVVDYNALLRSAARAPQVLALLMEAMGEQLTRGDQAHDLLSSLPVDARVAQFLANWTATLESHGLRSDEFNVPLSRAEIGTHLGVTLESVSRAMSRLAREDLIRFADGRRRCITVPDAHALSEFARRQSTP